MSYFYSETNRGLAGVRTWTQTWTLPPDQRVVKVLSALMSQNKVCGVWILFRSCQKRQNWGHRWDDINPHPPDWVALQNYDPKSLNNTATTCTVGRKTGFRGLDQSTHIKCSSLYYISWTKLVPPKKISDSGKMQWPFLQQWFCSMRSPCITEASIEVMLSIELK